jgi:DNA-binding response OmpR family regulator
MTKTLLLIEDSFTIQQVVQMAFGQDDIDVITATTLAEALRELQHVTPDVIVADASLPEVDGFRLCQTMRDMDKLRHVPVVLLTSGFTAYDEAQGERTGVTGHLAKPFEAHALRQLVQQVLESSHTAASLPQETLQTSTPAPPSEAMLARTPGVSEHGVRQAAPPQQERQDLTALDTLMAQWTPATSTLATPTDITAAEELGRLMFQVIRETVQTHLASMLERMTPQILATVQDIVARETPELLESLLQREIDKLKQAVDADDRDGE